MWLVAGLLLGFGLFGLALWLRSQNIAVAWYEWLLAALGIVLMIFTIQNYQAATIENEPYAPGMFLLVFGLPALILILIAIGLVIWRQFRPKKKSAPVEAAEA
jgi:uncharacterized membrane protein